MVEVLTAWDAAFCGLHGLELSDSDRGPFVAGSWQQGPSA